MFCCLSLSGKPPALKCQPLSTAALPQIDQIGICPCRVFFPSYFELGEDTFLCLVLPEIAHSNLLFSETRKASWHRVSLSCCANVSFALRKEANYTMHHTVRFAKRGRKGKGRGRTVFQHARFNDFGKLSTWIKKKNLNLTVSQ